MRKFRDIAKGFGVGIFAAWLVTTLGLDGARLLQAQAPRFPYTQDPVTGLVTWIFPQIFPPGYNRNSAALLATPYNLYANPTGSNSNDCQAAVQSTTIANRGPCASAQYALNVGSTLDANGEVVNINLSNSIFNENVSLTGPSVGTTKAADFNESISGTKKLRLKGVAGGGLPGNHGSTIKGVPTIGGRGYCYVVFADSSATLGLQDLTIDATTTNPTNSCYGVGQYQSAIYAQMGGRVFVDGNVHIAGATANGVALEEEGRLYLTPGCTVCGNLSFSGDYGINIFNADAKSLIEADSTINISGTVNVNSGFGSLVYLETLSLFKASQTNPFAFPNTGVLNARTYNINDTSVLRIYQPVAADNPFGTHGTKVSIRNSNSIIDAGQTYSTPCVGGAAGCANTTAPTGLGTGGTQVMAAASGMRSGLIELHTGTTAATSGIIAFAMPDWPNPGICEPGPPVNGTGTWDAAAKVNGQGFALAVDPGATNGGSKQSWVWSNNGVALADNKIYYIPYSCHTSN